MTEDLPFVFSINPAWVEMILAGTKTWELRKSRPDMAVHDLFLIYETAPTSMIVASVYVTRIFAGDPDEVWDATSEGAGVSREFFDKYYRGKSRAVAIGLAGARWLPRPVPLPSTMKPPMAWSRLKLEPGVSWETWAAASLVPVSWRGR